MNAKSFALGSISVMSLTVMVWAAQPEAAPTNTPKKPAPTEASTSSATGQKKITDRATLERVFKDMLTDSILKGTWQMTHAEKEGGKIALSAPREEQYTIDKVSKASGDYWIIMARIQYADKDVRIPVTVRVVFAEDTPIITLDDMKLPGLGTYSARVMIYRNFYAGTWFGCGYGGLLSGEVLKQADQSAATTQPAKT